MVISNTVIRVTKKLSYDVSKVSHGLTVGGTGSGKSYFLNFKILRYASMGSDIYICDPKRADLHLIGNLENFPQKHVATSAGQICGIFRVVNGIMEKRYEEYFSDVSAFGKTFLDFDLSPVVIFFDEFSAFIRTAENSEAEELKRYLFNIIMKGRQMGVFVELVMQRPDASILDGAIRDQIGCRVALGNMSSDGRRMIFGPTEIDYRTVKNKGGGYIQIDGTTEEPVYFETPYFEKGFDFLGELSRYY